MLESSNKKGFTLVELLIVIFIIGLLASLIMGAVMISRNKAKDARITAAISQVRSIAQMIHFDYESYDNLCSGGTLNEGEVIHGPQLKIIEDDVELQQAGSLSLSCYTGTDTYCVGAKLIAGGYYCVDSTGRAAVYSDDDCSVTSPSCTP